MEHRELICIGCPKGCSLSALMDGREVKSVQGNACSRGEAYARKELTNPTRIVTSSVRIEGAKEKMLSVKTERDIPKDQIFACIKVIKSVIVKAPVSIGDVVIEDVAGTGVNVVATKTIVRQ